MAYRRQDTYTRGRREEGPRQNRWDLGEWGWRGGGDAHELGASSLQMASPAIHTHTHIMYKLYSYTHTHTHTYTHTHTFIEIDPHIHVSIYMNICRRFQCSGFKDKGLGKRDTGLGMRV